MDMIKKAGKILLAAAAAITIAYLVYAIFWILLYALIAGAVAGLAWLIYKLIG
jgi:hypothetical protein